MQLNDQQRWQAVRTNDAHYDGQFVYAVHTTGIFCRPSCPSRTPKRENVCYFSTPEEAISAGFRPCKRCQPDDTPPDDTARIVAEVCRLIEAAEGDRLTLKQLARKTHISPSHLHRIFSDAMGITPRQYADAVRAGQFKAQLKDGVSVTDAAAGAGFSSSSRVHSHAKTHLGMTPSDYQSGAADMTIRYDSAACDLGYVLIAMTDRGVCAVEMGDDVPSLVENLRQEFPAAELIQDDSVQAAVSDVLAYLNGWQPHITLPLDIRVTAFQQRVLDELTRIPYGETRTYAEIARAVGNPRAARAVGQVCNRNPVPIIIPCHRVVRSDGKIDGYAFGTERKRTLLELENERAAELVTE